MISLVWLSHISKTQAECMGWGLGDSDREIVRLKMKPGWTSLKSGGGRWWWREDRDQIMKIGSVSFYIKVYHWNP